MELILQSTQNKVVGNLNPQAYTADAQTIADLSMLVSSKIYTDNISAVIREISCNAYDANLEAGSKRRFKLVAPHYSQGNSPFIEWRDFGEGLSESGISNIYASLMKSTKRNKKNPIGCFGVGSKSPFSYSNNFTVESFYNGVHYFYSMQKTDAGFMHVKMGEEKTKEPNGLKVNVPIKLNDVNNFREKIKEYFFYWKEEDLPEFENLDFQSPDNLKSYIKGDYWEIFSNNFNTYDFTVLMGNVLYTVNRNELDVPSHVNLNNYSGYMVTVPLGFFSPHISRETLDYNEYTTSQFKKLFDDIGSKVQQELTSELDKEDSFVDAFRKYERYSKIGISSKSNFSYKGLDLFKYRVTRVDIFNLIYHQIEKNPVIDTKTEEGRKKFTALTTSPDFCIREKTTTKSRKSEKIKFSNYCTDKSIQLSVNYHREQEYFIDDCNYKYAADNKDFLKFLYDKFKVSHFKLVTPNFLKCADLLKKYYGAKYVRFRSLAKLYKRYEEEYRESKRSKKLNERRTFSGVEICSFSSDRESIVWNKNHTVDLAQGGFYCDTRVSAYNKEKSFKMYKLINILKTKELINKNTKLYGFKHSILRTKEFAANKDKWISQDQIEEYFHKKIKKDTDIFCFLLLKPYQDSFGDGIWKMHELYIEKMTSILSEIKDKTDKERDYDLYFKIINKIIKVKSKLFGSHHNLIEPKINTSRKLFFYNQYERLRKIEVFHNLFRDRSIFVDTLVILEKFASKEEKINIIRRAIEKSI